MKIITHILAMLLTAVLILFFINRGLSPLNTDYANTVLDNNRNAVEKHMNEASVRILLQLTGFASTVAGDRDFAMKLIVENDYHAPEVAEIAGRYIRAMGFSFLEITDADYKILSSGHFPASAGNIAVAKKEMPDSTLVWMDDNITGAHLLSIQIKIPFSCEGMDLYCIGGLQVDQNFISALKPHENSTVLLKQENDILGDEDIETMSELKDNRIVINDKTWLAFTMPLFWRGETNKPELYILMEEPENFSLLDLF